MYPPMNLMHRAMQTECIVPTLVADKWPSKYSNTFVGRMLRDIFFSQKIRKK